MKAIKDKHIVVIGAARSGVAAAELLHKKGAQVFVTDHHEIGASFRDRLKKQGIPFEERGHTQRAEQADFAVVSPGVPDKTPLVQKYLNSGRKVYSEIEAASWFNRGPIVAVTGSNGKTTVINWLDYIWKQAGKDHLTAGNIGDAFSDKVFYSSPDKESLLEVSSFQLDHIDTFHPYISLLLNITPDHLDRYDNSFEKYAATKFRITENQTADDWVIYHQNDPVIHRNMQILRQKKKRLIYWLFHQPKRYSRGLTFKIKQSC